MFIVLFFPSTFIIVSINWSVIILLFFVAQNASQSCYNAIKESWAEINKVASQPGGLESLRHTFNTCKWEFYQKIKDVNAQFYSSWNAHLQLMKPFSVSQGFQREYFGWLVNASIRYVRAVRLSASERGKDNIVFSSVSINNLGESLKEVFSWKFE